LIALSDLLMEPESKEEFINFCDPFRAAFKI